ncbi:MAG: Cyanophycinase [Pseudidiomarina mangrovi]|nr:MAG: Cyanophycinase [Pseudidiomarina mangrovi]
MHNNKGTLTLIGGAEDRGSSDGVLKTMVEKTKAKYAAVVPTASMYGYELGDEYKDCFRRLGVDKTEILDIKERRDTENPRYLEIAKEADLIFFTGGDQVKLAHVFLHTELLKIIKNRHFLSGLHLAGTSAGAMIMSDPLIYEGDGKDFQKGAVFYEPGFGITTGITVDTHFMERGRIPRICAFLASGYSKRGIGVGEDTGAIITPDDKLEVVGSGTVVMFNADKMRYSNFHNIKEDELIDIDNVAMSFLVNESRFDMAKWTQIKPTKRRKIIAAS